MKIVKMLGLGLGIGVISLTVQAQTSVAASFANITIDGSFADWSSVPLAYTAPVGSSTAIQYENVYIANDANDLFIRVTLYSPRADAFANSFDNLFVDADNNASTGNPVGGIGSEMLIQDGNGYQEKNGGFNEAAINNLGWALAGSTDSTDFEFEISRNATYASDATTVFANNSIAILLEGDDAGFNNVEFAPASGGLVYTFAPTPVPEPATVGLTLVGFCLLIGSRRLVHHREKIPSHREEAFVN